MDTKDAPKEGRSKKSTESGGLEEKKSSIVLVLLGLVLIDSSLGSH